MIQYIVNACGRLPVTVKVRDAVELQKMLQKLLKIKADGSFGPGTTKALMIAQEKHSLKVDGICGPASWKAISGANKYL